mmetsp:Transcript_22548/g.57514  ORF Transcript_22548/g.57514 Transcript_22548/m.57514 type:complete len:303 (-) Transcript_22548:700-1608(-)
MVVDHTVHHLLLRPPDICHHGLKALDAGVGCVDGSQDLTAQEEDGERVTRLGRTPQPQSDMHKLGDIQPVSVQLLLMAAMSTVCAVLGLRQAGLASPEDRLLMGAHVHQMVHQRCVQLQQLINFRSRIFLPLQDMCRLSGRQRVANFSHGHVPLLLIRSPDQRGERFGDPFLLSLGVPQLPMPPGLLGGVVELLADHGYNHVHKPEGGDEDEAHEEENEERLRTLDDRADHVGPRIGGQHLEQRKHAPRGGPEVPLSIERCAIPGLLLTVVVGVRANHGCHKHRAPIAKHGKHHEDPEKGAE